MIRSNIRTLRLGVTLLCALGIAACTGGEQRPGEQQQPQVLGSEGEGSNLERFDLRAQGRLMTVQVFNRGGGARAVVVSARSYRGLDRADGQLALEAAYQAGRQMDCAGQPMKVLQDTGIFQEAGRRSAFTQGEAAWIFQGRCG